MRRWRLRLPIVPATKKATSKSGLFASRTARIRGADERSRTLDLLITNELLYQLSYIGVWHKQGL
jgi:hypothetical protein